MGVRALRAVDGPGPDPRLCEMMLIPVEDLVVPHTYQRVRDDKRCQKAAANFDPNLFHPLVVERSSGNKWNVNQGQHRARIAEIVGIPAVWCMVARTDKPGETFVDAAREQKPLKPHEQHRALCSDRHSQALRIEHLLSSYGFRVGDKASTRGVLSCVTLCYQAVFGSDSKIGSSAGAYGCNTEEALRFALSSIRDAWGADCADSASRSGSMVDGLGLLYSKYSEEIDAQRVATVLAEAGARVIDARASGRRRVEEGSHAVVRAREIVERYNAGLRGRRKLDPRKLERRDAR